MSSRYQILARTFMQKVVQVEAKEEHASDEDGATNKGGADNNDDALRKAEQDGDDDEDVDAELRSLNAEARCPCRASHMLIGWHWHDHLSMSARVVRCIVQVQKNGFTYGLFVRQTLHGIQA